MTKESKTTSTIRRKKGKHVAVALQKMRKENALSQELLPATVEEEMAAEKKDDCYLFDDLILGPNVLRRLMYNDRSLFLALLSIRCANALLIQTQYVPDEYWQSLEIAHKMVFGYGYETWEWKEGLRGYSYPLIFAILFKILHIFGLDSRIALIKLPRILQAVMAAYGDLCLYKLSQRMSGRATAQWALFCQMISWFMIYCSTRTLSNSMETVLITAALRFFPWPGLNREKNDIQRFLMLAATSVIMRPTAAIIWILLCSWHLQKLYSTLAFSSVVKMYMIVGSTVFGCSLVIDRIWYDKWTFVQLNFLTFNILRGVASIYGSHPWHWYLSQGFPAVMGSLSIPFVMGAWKAPNKVLLWIILWIVATHSFLPHKEFRFVLPAIPLAMHFCGVYFQHLCNPPTEEEIKLEEKSEIKSKVDAEEKAKQKNIDEAKEECESSELSRDRSKEELLKKSESEPTEKDEDEKKAAKHLEDKLKECEILGEKRELKEEIGPEAKKERKHREKLKRAKWLMIFLSLTNIIPAFYFCLIHQRATVTVTKFLSDQADKNPYADILFIMPCHSTPYYSYLHQNISMRFLTCEPNLQGNSDYLDEADAFYANPNSWLLEEYTNAKRPLPSHLVFFNVLHKKISPWMVQSGYKLCERIFHTHLPEGRVGSHVFVSCR